MSAEPTIAEFRVRYAETDQMGVVYHANYLVWCEIGRTEYLRSRGTSYRDTERAGVRLAVAEAMVRYHAPARYEDVVRVVTTLTEARSRALTFDYVITDAEHGTRFATARTLLVSLGPGGRVAPLPTAFLDELAHAHPHP